ncbi:uroporphyrinogen-III synthase [Lentibacillus persicus]|uniref:Uroporphyrinogen-III synthase n=1 Tax=Lentibacillus persicus TaxID=640948 RepID=A0A1I1TIN0_9BACI|nr:uroporphyrinogen-III synthase [Lentibacillus persicus]SFD58476.1 uroporphyrinogen-III synthase [Lentibacillus persicus]
MASPLKGKKVLITREKAQANELAHKVEQHKGVPEQIPLLTITCHHNQASAAQMQEEAYKWVFFTSANGVHCFFSMLRKYDFSKDILSEANFAVVGRKTGRALEGYGYYASFVPETYDAETMTREFFQHYDVLEEPVLLVRGNWSRDTLPRWLEGLGVRYSIVEVYQTGYNYTMKDTLNAKLAQNELDALTFTSPSSVNAFVEMAETSIAPDIPIVCIGTTTADQASELGLANLLVPEEFTIDGMLAKLEEVFAQKG